MHNIGAAKAVIDRRYKSGDILSEVANTLEEMMEAYHDSGGLVSKEVSDAIDKDVMGEPKAGNWLIFEPRESDSKKVIEKFPAFKCTRTEGPKPPHPHMYYYYDSDKPDSYYYCIPSWIRKATLAEIIAAGGGQPEAKPQWVPMAGDRIKYETDKVKVEATICQAQSFGGVTLDGLIGSFDIGKCTLIERAPE